MTHFAVLSLAHRRTGSRNGPVTRVFAGSAFGRKRWRPTGSPSMGRGRSRSVCTTVSVVTRASVSTTVVAVTELTMTTTRRRRSGSVRVSSSARRRRSVTFSQRSTCPFNNNNIAVAQSLVVKLIVCFFGISMIFKLNKSVRTVSGIRNVTSNDWSISKY